MPEGFPQASRDNFRGTWETIVTHYPVGEVRQFGSIPAISAGLDSPMYNRVFVFELRDVDDLAAAAAWQSNREVSFDVFVADAAIVEVERHVESLGVEPMGASFPGMILDPLAEVTPGDADADIHAVATDADFDGFCTVLSGIPEFPADVRR